jgi:cytoskeletal protein CcmA (bactofilin family)
MSEPEEQSQISGEPLEQKPRSPSSRLGPTATLKGDWICDEEVVILGQIQGKIDAGENDIRIEKEAVAKAEIKGKNITISGKVTGNITASGKITVSKEAKITGDLSAHQIAIQDGAKFIGTVKMLPKTT